MYTSITTSSAPTIPLAITAFVEECKIEVEPPPKIEAVIPPFFVESKASKIEAEVEPKIDKEAEVGILPIVTLFLKSSPRKPPPPKPITSRSISLKPIYLPSKPSVLPRPVVVPHTTSTTELLAAIDLPPL